MPDVRLSPKERDAIKFTTINIRFELAPGATEEIKASFQRIQEKLESKGTVEMSSSGNYYYRYS
jgi:effector-binding domain-containing protein